MGKLRKRHNQKARVQVDTKIDHSLEKKIRLDPALLGLGPGLSDDIEQSDSNILALPASKRKTQKIPESPKPKKLTKKQRKRLEKVVEKKEKKAQRKDLLEALVKIQASKEEMQLLQSTANMQSKKAPLVSIKKTPDGQFKINALTGKNKQFGMKNKEKNNEDNIEVDIDNSSSSDDSDSEYDGEFDDNSKTAQIDLNCHDDKPSKNNEKNEINTPLNNKPRPILDEASKKDESKGSSTPISELIKADVRPSIHVTIDRKQEIQEQRLRLPIVGEEQIIMEAICDNSVVIICGETGSGKTTQVPQFLYEAGYTSNKGIIGVTEPRRVAAISMSARVATEMNLSSRVVSYQIRYEGNTTSDTKVKFMTDGVLLKEVQRDFLLTSYSVIIIDEAHERSVYTDILIGLLSRIVPLRHKRGNPLKLIIMSATLRVEDFTENHQLFALTPPVLKVESRQFPVTVHFNNRTNEDYLGEAFRKVCKIHRLLPAGGVLVFVTGQQEVHTLVKKLQMLFSKQIDKRKERKDIQTSNRKTQIKPELPDINLDNYSVNPLDEEALMEGSTDDQMSAEDDSHLSGDDDDDDDYYGSDTQVLEEGLSQKSDQPLYILPLYSLLSSECQKKVFEAPPEGHRLCVIATNVAETSLTIPGVKYVVDTGKTKTKLYDKVTGVSTFKVMWTSQASANQRAGRAGRTSPGHCYRLYSSAVFNDFDKFSPPEITRRPVEDLVLQMKAMNIDKVVNFPFPTPPSEESLKAAESILVSLGAISPVIASQFKRKKKDAVTKITNLGKTMASFPVSPRYAKMLALGHQHNLLPYIVAIVSALSVQELLIDGSHPKIEQGESLDKKQQIHQLRKTMAKTGEALMLGDLFVLLQSVGAAEFVGCSSSFCDNYGIRFKAMLECRKLRKQLTDAVNTVLTDTHLVVDPKMSPPTDLQLRLLRQIVLSGLSDHVARKMPDPRPGAGKEEKKFKHAYQSTLLEEPVFIHPSSVLHKNKTAQYVVYQHIVETDKLYMKGITDIDPQWLPIFAPQYCTFSKPLNEDYPPEYDDAKGIVTCHMTNIFGHCGWPIPAVQLEYPHCVEKYRYFAKFLLEGKVLKQLEVYTSVYLTAPVTMIKTWAKLQPRTETLLKALMAEDVNSKDKLLRAWKRNPKYLMSAFHEWIPENLYETLNKSWPPVK